MHRPVTFGPVKEHHASQSERTAFQSATDLVLSLLSSGTTIGVPTSGVRSGISSIQEEHSVPPQQDTQVAADILVVQQQGQQEGLSSMNRGGAMGCDQHQYIEQYPAKKRKIDTEILRV